MENDDVIPEIIRKSKQNDDVRGIDKAVVESKLTYADISPLKQRRTLKRINKALKRAKMSPMTHKDMLKQLNWDRLRGVYKDITVTVVTTLNTMGKILLHETLPKEVLESEPYKVLIQTYTALGVNLQQKILDIRNKHWTEENSWNTGLVAFDDQDMFAECTAEYIDVRTELMSQLGHLEDPLSALLSIIKVEKIRQLSEEADSYKAEEDVENVSQEKGDDDVSEESNVNVG